MSSRGEVEDHGDSVAASIRERFYFWIAANFRVRAVQLQQYRVCGRKDEPWLRRIYLGWKQGLR